MFPPEAPLATKVVVKHNALNANMMDELEATYGLFARDERVRAVVPTGAGRSFCVGMDLTEGPQGLMQIKEDEVAMEQWKDVGGVIALATSNCIKPTIVPVNGSAAGFGLTSILSATIRVAWKDAKVSMPFSRRGLTMGSRGAFYLPKLIRTWP